MNNILLIHAGGTLGMVKVKSEYVTQPGNLRNLINSKPSIACKILRTNEKTSNNCKMINKYVDTFITPCLRNGKIAQVDIFEFSVIKDSSNSSIDDWILITETIEKFYDSYDAFVVAHGTDTLSYAASGVSFMIEGLTVPIIFTGSMLPMVVEGSDAESNLIGAIEASMLTDVPGVYIFFNSWLHYATRTTKISSTSVDSFFSTNPIRIEELARANTDSKISGKPKEKPIFNKKMSTEVGLFKIFPSIHIDHFTAIFQVYKGVILECYGCGTFPSNRTDLLNQMKRYIEDGGVIVKASQCPHGHVTDSYESSNLLLSVGAISARNMTTESAFAKLSFLLANTPNRITEFFCVSLRGEIEDITEVKHLTFNRLNDMQK